MRKKQSFLAKKICRFCGSVEQEQSLDYKNSSLLRSFITERGKILPSRVSGNCFFHQRLLAKEIKTSRAMALLPYSPMHI
ncbi:30S ribosomal protein S18 [Candidatus Babeliales bacterium]|nr:30S ribosomal protein S18 [Candidatus Babeliales bacterium]